MLERYNKDSWQQRFAQLRPFHDTDSRNRTTRQSQVSHFIRVIQPVQIHVEQCRVFSVLIHQRECGAVYVIPPREPLGYARYQAGLARGQLPAQRHHSSARQEFRKCFSQPARRFRRKCLDDPVPRTHGVAMASRYRCSYAREDRSHEKSSAMPALRKRLRMRGL